MRHPTAMTIVGRIVESFAPINLVMVSFPPFDCLEKSEINQWILA